jgi:S1-C subfamily serine protease
MLTPEEKQRIADEERKRLEEEQYRAQVRRDLQSRPEPSPQAPGRSRTLKVALILVAVAVFLCAVVLLLIRYNQSGDNTSPQAATEVQDENPDKPSPSPSPVTPAKLTTAKIAELATPWVVVVESFNEDGGKAGQGSGYVSSADGAVVTNYHVIRGAKSANVKVPGKGSVSVEWLLGYSIENDVAVLQIPGSAISQQAVPDSDQQIRQQTAAWKRQNQEYFSNSADKLAGKQATRQADTTTSVQPTPAEGLSTERSPQIQVGDHVVAIGAPLGLENTVSEGIVSAVRNAGGTRIFQTTASISPGSSGGPLLNDYGNVIGLTTAYMKDGQNLNFVISSEHIFALLDQKRQMSLSEMLAETRASYPLPGSTISVPARSAMQLSFTVNAQQGMTLEGSYTVSGGWGSDIGVMLVGPGGTVIVNSGRVSRSGQFSQRLPRGQYAIVFDNRSSLFSSKSVSPDLKLVYYR